jgi:fructose PTS system EIIBC or EIIC component
MKLVAVTACPAGMAHTVMAAEALRRQAAVMGHDLAVETQGAEGPRDVLPEDAVSGADAVIIAADVHVDLARFAGKPVRAVSTAEAIRRTDRVITDAVAAVGGDEVAPEPVAATSPDGVVDARRAPDADPDGDGDGGPRRLVAVTSCPTGIAHTFMAAEGLRKAAEDLGHWIKVETQGSVGAKNVLTPEDVAGADAVIIAADTKVDRSRFAGKAVYETGTKEALRNGADVVHRALALPPVPAGSGAAPPPPAPGAGSGGDGRGRGRPGAASLQGVYQHLMTGVSHMLPLIVAGGLLIAIAFAFDIDANDPALADTLAGRLFQVGGAAFSLFLPVLAGYVAYSIADRPGLAPGFVGGFLAVQVDTGFLGAILAGFLAGYLTRWLADVIRLPNTLAGLKPVLILPLLATLVVGAAMFYVIGQPVSWLQQELTDWLQGLQGANAAVLGMILGGMMALDMGGPLNKVAYTFSVGLIDAGITEPMAAVMAAGMTPPLGLALATVLFKRCWLAEEREAGRPAWVLGLSFITEGAIPFAARDPLRVIPALIVGSAVAGGISLGFGTGMIVPHGGALLLLVPGAVTEVLGWVLALVVGTLVTTAVLFVTKRAGVDEPVPPGAPDDRGAAVAVGT